ncbi:hypothetical protein F5141DRAFT_1186020 [Pisolithus sp. B1]|nr:hypothetical protein F5141DRAFT_1186020 [Pisolithus sp. B1]
MEAAEGMWVPFNSEEEWELAHFLMKNMGQTRMDEFLKLNIVQQNGVSFENACTLLKCMDKLCTGPAWTCEVIDMEGDLQHDPVECVCKLMGNPAFWEVMSYVPEHVYADAKGENHIYDEMWTSDWWWNVQKKLPEGIIVAPIILSLDKTTLSQFSSDKKAWPVHLTIGNISKDVRQQVAAHATLLIGYLPVSKLECFHKKSWSLVGHHLFHHAMSLLLHPLVDSGLQGREMICANGYLCRQCLNTLPTPHCLVQSNQHGDLEECMCHRMADMLKTLMKFNAKGLHAVFNPFWKELPFTDIFTCLTPNILHQLHKGIFHDHLLQWCISIIGKKETDAHFQAMTQYPCLRHFKKGISFVLQWTGTEHKEMERVFVGLLASAVDDHVLVVAHSLLDFIYYAQLQQHMDTTLTAMEESLKTFHGHKHILVELQIHSLKHYVSSIRALGSADSYNTEYPEQLHINYAKDRYWASNKWDYVEQMALWLQHQEAVHYKSTYLAWRKSCADTDLPGTLVLQIPVKTHYKVAKNPSHHQVSIFHIESDYKASEFIPALKHFLISHLDQCWVIQPSPSDWFDMYNHFVIMGHARTVHKIHASPKVGACGHKVQIPTRFDTVFMLGGEHPRMEIIFNLPDYLRSFPHPLAYVKWFTALQQHDPVSSLYIITRSTRNCCHNVSVISIDCIIHLCHLQVWCGREIGLVIFLMQIEEQLP